MKFTTTQSDPLNVLASTLPVVENAGFVKIIPANLDELAIKVKERFAQGLYSHDEGYGTTGDLQKDLQLVFVEDSINFCFWSGQNQPKWSVEWPLGNTTTGGWFSLIGCFKRGLVEGVPILEADYLRQISVEDARNFFRSATGTEIPLLSERVDIFHEIGAVLTEKFAGQIINLIEESEYQADRIIKNVLQHFPSFRDASMYEGKEVRLLKRVQIFAYDLTFPLRGRGKKLSGLDQLTSFADYKLPQILRMFGVFEYKSELAEKVDNFIEIPHDSREEIEIRASTIWAVELLRQRLPELTTGQIDLTLWLISQDVQDQAKPYHRTRTIYY